MLILFGQQGQVATEVRRLAEEQRIPLTVYSKEEADFRSPERIEEILMSAPSGSVIINAAAYTQVDQAELDSDAAYLINASTPGHIARCCKARDLSLIHLSTDYVFSGEKTSAYREEDPTGPLGVYGASKRQGEVEILEALDQAIILRTSWVFSAHGTNFVKTMLRLGTERNELKIVSDQSGGPTSAASIASTCLTLAGRLSDRSVSPSQFGIYHYSGTPETTWYGFATEIFRQSGLDVTIHPIPSSEYPTRAIRPSNSVLNCQKIEASFGISQPSWIEDLSFVLKDLAVPRQV